MSETILICEDDDTLRAVLEERAKSFGYTVTGSTSSGREAVMLVAKQRPSLVLMDISVAGPIDGIQAAKLILQLDIPVIYVTGYSEGPMVKQAEESAPYGYIVKPFETHDLRIGMQVALRRKQDAKRRLAEAAEMAAATTLGGKLPICCHCKRIKETTDRWTQIETYIMQRAKVTFSHGLCPECLAKQKE